MKNMPTSARARLLNIAKKEKVPFQRLLTLYSQEGLLHRIVSTEYKDEVVLKGGLLFYQLQGVVSRPYTDPNKHGLWRRDYQRPNTKVLQDSTRKSKVLYANVF